MLRTTLITALSLAFAGTALAANAGDLWTTSPSYRSAKGADSALAALSADPANRVAAFVDVSTAVDTATQSLQFDLGNGLQLNARLLNSEVLDSGNTLWHGLLNSSSDYYGGRKGETVLDDPMNNIMMVREGNLLTANIRVNGALYKLRPLKDGSHVLIEVNDWLMPPDHGKEHVDQESGDAAFAAVVDEPSRANTTIRVMVHATTAAVNASGSVSSLIDLAFSEANQSYTNSGISITIQQAGKYSIAYTESGSFSTDLGRYRSTNDGVMDSIHSTRNSNTADIAVLMINNSSSCGLASAIGASASTAFAAVHWDCATGYYSFGHEIGHLQAARHDPANDPTTTPYAYGHGYQYAAGGWRTVMAYNCAGGCTRINNWSNPSKTRNGVPMGTTAKSDNARVLNNTRATMAGFR